MRDASYYQGSASLSEAEVGPLRFGLASVRPLLEESMTKPTAGKRWSVHVEVNHGRWVVACPDCGSAQLASEVDARFLCHECVNGALEGRWRPIVWPPNRGQIEDALGVRSPDRQNWIAGETVADLLEEADAKMPPPPSRTAPKTWAGHTHSWPKRLPKSSGVVECEECHLMLPASMIRADRNAES